MAGTCLKITLASIQDAGQYPNSDIALLPVATIGPIIVHRFQRIIKAAQEKGQKGLQIRNIYFPAPTKSIWRHSKAGYSDAFLTQIALQQSKLHLSIICVGDSSQTRPLWKTISVSPSLCILEGFYKPFWDALVKFERRLDSSQTILLGTHAKVGVASSVLRWTRDPFYERETLRLVLQFSGPPLLFSSSSSRHK